MNANELADKLEDDYWDSRANKVMLESAKMLIQQQDRIGVLEANHKIQLDINEKALQYISDLEKGLESSINLNKAQAERHGKNEPVAWMYESKNVDGKPYISDVSLKPLFGLVARYGYKEIPLYTHPAKELDEQFKKGFESGKEEGWKAHKFHHPAKTLTDEEILQFRDKVPYSLGSDLIDFARAILKKASEK